jgi:hypothetical protein
VSFCEDEWLRDCQDAGRPLWVASLSDGREFWADDGRPGAEPHSAWLRLKALVEREELRVVGLRLKFRSVQKSPLPAYADGYFFSKGLVAAMGGAQTHFFLVGALVDGALRVQKWQVPEMILFEEEERDARLAGDSLIRNHGRRTH